MQSKSEIQLEQMPLDKLQSLTVRRRKHLLMAFLEEAEKQLHTEKAQKIEALLESEEPLELSHFSVYWEAASVKEPMALYVMTFEVLEDREIGDIFAHENIQQRGKLIGIATLVLFLFVGLFIYFQSNENPYEKRLNRLRSSELNNFRTFQGVAGKSMEELIEAISPTSPRFQRSLTSYAEFLRLPASSPRSSRIHVWLAQNPKGLIKEIAVTGFSNTRSYRRFYSFLYSLAITEGEALPDDFLLTGVARLQFRKARALQSFMRELNKLSRKNSLIQLHQLPYGLLKEARERLQAAIQSGDSQVLSFRDLLKKYQVDNAILFEPVRLLLNTNPVKWSFTLGDVAMRMEVAGVPGTLRQNLYQSIVGNVDRRSRFYTEQLKDSKQQVVRCEKLKKSNSPTLQKKVRITQVCSKDGSCKVALKPVEITQGKYCSDYIFRNAKTLERWLSEVKQVKSKVMSKKSLKRLQALVSKALWDASLRDTVLPLWLYQRSFLEWKSENRHRLWRQLYASMPQSYAFQVPFAKEPLLFLSDRSGKRLNIRPFWRIDLADNFVVIKADSPWPRIRSVWGSRKLKALSSVSAPELTSKQEPATQPSSLKTKPTTSSATATLPVNSKNILHPLKQALLLALASKEHVKYLMQAGLFLGQFDLFWNLEFSDHSLLPNVSEKVKKILVMRDVLKEFAEINPAFMKKDGLYSFLRDSRYLQKKYETLPPELTWKIAFFAAAPIAQTLQNYTSRKFTAWEVIQMGLNVEPLVAGRASKRLRVSQMTLKETMKAMERLKRNVAGSPSRFSRLKQSLLWSREFQEKVGEAPATIIRRAIELLKTQSPAFYAHLEKTKGNPKRPSKKLKEVQEFKPRSLFSMMAIDLWEAKNILQNYERLVKTITALQSSHEITVAEVREMLEEVDLFTRETLDVFHRFDRVLGSLQDSAFIRIAKTRIKTASTLARGAEKLRKSLRRKLQKYERVLPQIPIIRSLRARLLSLEGAYKPMIRELLQKRTTLAYYHPDLKWLLHNTKLKGRIDQIEAKLKDGKLSIEVSAGSKPFVPILTLMGVSNVHLRRLKTLLEEAPRSGKLNGFRSYEKVLGTFFLHEKLLMLPVPLRAKVKQVFTQWGKPELASLFRERALFTCWSPAQIFVKSEAECLRPDLSLKKLKMGYRVLLPKMKDLIKKQK